jgi:hypothetical protein
MLIADLKWIDYGFSTRDEASLLVLKPAYCLNLTLAIGTKGNSGSDYFYTNVFNVGMVQREKVLVINKGMVVVLKTLDDIENYLSLMINSISGETWDDIVIQLQKYFDWEYEGYREV